MVISPQSNTVAAVPADQRAQSKCGPNFSTKKCVLRNAWNGWHLHHTRLYEDGGGGDSATINAFS